jgi:uncharacterized repeat protein (TIGR04076 family)
MDTADHHGSPMNSGQDDIQTLGLAERDFRWFSSEGQLIKLRECTTFYNPISISELRVIPITSYGFAIKATVKRIKGKCSVGYRVGDEIIFDGLHIKGKVCPSALAIIVPTIYAFMWGAEFPWDEDRDTTDLPCADSKNQVVFELKRDRKHPWFKKKERSS